LRLLARKLFCDNPQCARLAQKLGLHASRNMLLRLIRKTPPPFTTPSVLGIDDWAIRKRCAYGTLLVSPVSGHK
jgi:hypothetical protein